MAADMSLRLGWIEAGLVDRIRALNEKAKLPTAPPPVGGLAACRRALARGSAAQPAARGPLPGAPGNRLAR